MDTIKIARRLAERGQTADAQRAYTLALQAAGLSRRRSWRPPAIFSFPKATTGWPIPASCLFYRQGLFQKELLS